MFKALSGSSYGILNYNINYITLFFKRTIGDLYSVYLCNNISIHINMELMSVGNIFKADK